MNRSSVTLHHARLWQGLGWALVAIVVWLSLDPSPPAPPDFLAWDKAQHALAYGTLAWWFRQSFAPHRRWPLFLVGLGIYYLFFKKFHTQAELDQGVKIKGTTHAKLFITGFLINTLNPGVIALWLAAATKALSNAVDERFVIFGLCLSMNIGADFFKINLAGKLRKKLTDENIRIVNKISGSLFVAFGIALLAGVLYATAKHI